MSDPDQPATPAEIWALGYESGQRFADTMLQFALDHGVTAPVCGIAGQALFDHVGNLIRGVREHGGSDMDAALLGLAAELGIRERIAAASIPVLVGGSIGSIN